LHLLPSNQRLSTIELHLLSAARGEFALRDALAGLRGEYDWVFLDCPPTLAKLTINALICADRVIVPVKPEPMDTDMFRSFLETYRGVRLHSHPKLELAGVIFTRRDARASLGRTIISDLARKFRGAIPVLGEVRNSVKVQEAALHRLPVTRYRPAGDVAADYQGIVEVLRAARERQG
jgi:chromosome partitioning protein